MTTAHKPGLIVLETKLNRPIVTRDLVVRPRLLKQLNAGLEGAITLVVAPAGFGKTTLVSSWLAGANGDSGISLPSTWLSLDEGDSDSEVFLRYFIAALRVIFPEACPESLKLLNARQQPPARVLTSMLSNEIEKLPSPFVMVMDDLHAPHGRALFDNLNEWLHHWPRQMHLVLLSRFNPPLPLTSLRAKGLLTEIRVRDLRFSEAETAEYFNRVMGPLSDESAITLLQQRLEGWIAGLKMASLSLSGRESAQELTAALLDNEIFIADYLVDEVVAGQPPEIQRFLLKTSLVEPISVPLAEALLGDEEPDCNVRDCMKHIESADLFLIPLEGQHEWYRYHHIFRDVLRQKLSAIMPATQIEEMHARAAGWYFAQGFPDQAIHHALEANDLKLAASYMEQGLCEVLDHEDRPMLERWLRTLPEDFIEKSPELLLMRAFAHGFRWEPELMTRAGHEAEMLIDKSDRSEHTQILLGLVGVVKGQAGYHANEFEQAMANSREALDKLPATWRYARGIASVYMGISIYSAGRPEAAEQFLAGQYESYRDKGDSYALRLLLATAINFIEAGNYEKAERTARTILQQAQQSGLPVMEGWGYYLLGFVNYEWNELKKAADYFRNGIDLFYMTQIAVARNGMIGLAHTAQACGRPEDALQIIDRLSGIDLETRGYEQMDTTSARARLLLASSGVEAAERWVHTDTFQLPSLAIWIEQISLARAHILLVRNKGADTRIALQILDSIGELAQRTANVRITIKVLALRALALLNLGDSAGARETLIHSVELARRGLFTRTFVDLGPQMQKLLSQVATHASIAKSVSRILAAFPAGEVARTPTALLPHSTPATQPAGSDDGELDEHLTPRELEILSLMAEPVSFREIASRMNISYTTARRYTINVYSKFGVHSRWEVVDSAIRKGIIARR